MRECYWCGKVRGHDQGCPGERPQPSHEPAVPPKDVFALSDTTWKFVDGEARPESFTEDEIKTITWRGELGQRYVGRFMGAMVFEDDTMDPLAPPIMTSSRATQ